uniref:Uncharacterized protein n=1 Tax=Rhizophora mucronata TaxID=61149 RepID=A0A2P2PPX0_RHIMU
MQQLHDNVGAIHSGLLMKHQILEISFSTIITGCILAGYSIIVRIGPDRPVKPSI